MQKEINYINALIYLTMASSAASEYYLRIQVRIFALLSSIDKFFIVNRILKARPVEH
jgi:hypothetical protein